MPHPERMICWTLCAWFCSASARPAFGVDDFAFFHENVMGTSLELRVLADDRESARGAEDRVLGEIDHLALIFSAYDSASEFSWWQAAPRGLMSLSPELFDVLSRHVAESIERAGATVLPLPPYSSDYDPIEELWSKFKGQLRRIAARTKDGLYKAVGETLDSVTIQDILGWFNHSGLYATHG